MKTIPLVKRFKASIWFLVLSFVLLPVPQNAFAQMTEGTEPLSQIGDPNTGLTPTDEGSQEAQASAEPMEQNETSLEIDPGKELIEISKEELDQLQEEIAKTDDPALKAEMLSVVAQEMQIVVTDAGTRNSESDGPARIDITTPEGQTQAIQQLESNAAMLTQNGVNQQAISALKDAITSGDKAKAEAIMSEMAQNMSPNTNGPSGPMGDFDKGMPVFEMMKDLGFSHGPMEVGPMGEMGGPGTPGMEIVDFKDFYSGVKVEEMGIAMMEKGGFSTDQIEQFTDKAKQEFFSHQGEGTFDPKMAFEGVFKEVFGQSGPMMEGPMAAGPQGAEVFGPNGSMEAMMQQGGPNGPMGSTEFNFTDFMANNGSMMGELAYMANYDPANHQGPNGPQGFEGPGQFSGGAQPGEFYGPGPGGPVEWQGGNFAGFDPASGFQPPADFNPAEGFQPGEFQAPDYQPPEYQPPPETIVNGGLPPPPPPPDPEGLQHHDLGDAAHVDGDAHACVAPNCS